MPTIDTLQQAFSVSDSDELMISQSDVARKATRAQLLAGVQPALAIPSGTLLGRMSAGVGAPETITLGANLTVGNGALNAPAAFVIDGLAAGAVPMQGDLVAVSQGGVDSAVPYAAFMSGLGQIGGISASNLTATATGGVLARTLAHYLADALSVESFGAMGDGATDDTAAFVAAAASGRPVRLDGRVYIVNGPLNLVGAAIIGVPGTSVIRRIELAPGGSWIQVSGASFYAFGVTFDAGNMASADMAAVSIAATCNASTLMSCSIIHATGSTSGCGLAVDGTAGSTCRVGACTFDHNTLHGLAMTGGGCLTVQASEAGGNGGCGLFVDQGVSCSLHSNSCMGNTIGISVGSWSAGAAAAALDPSCSIDANNCSNNSAWGIAVAAGSAALSANIAQGNGILTQGGGILARLGASRLSNNLVSGGGYGIDARGSWGTAITGNHVLQATIGLAVGGGQNLFVNGNFLLTNSWAIVVSAIEESLSATPTGPVTIAGNWIGFTTPQGGGIRILDAAQGLAVTGNDINGWGSATISQAMWLHTDAAISLG